MLMKQISYRILLLFLAIPCFYSFAQKGYEEGYVVLNSKDTLYGLVKDRKEHPFGRLYKKIKFKGKKGASKYKPSRILGYKKGGSTYESMWISSTGKFFDQNYKVIQGVGELDFLKVVQKGFLSYYYWEFEDADSGYIDSVGYFKREDSPMLVRVTQGIFGLKRKNLATFLEDCPDLALKIRNDMIKDPQAIVTFYNNCTKKNQ